MQRGVVRTPIEMQVVPCQSVSSQRRKGTTHLGEQRLSTVLNGVQINHERPCALASQMRVLIKLRRSWRKPVGVSLEILPWVIPLTLKRL